MNMEDRQPLIFWENGHGNVIEVSDSYQNIARCLSEIFFQQLKKNGHANFQRKKQPPSLIVVVLPEGGNHIYTAVKQ